MAHTRDMATSKALYGRREDRYQEHVRRFPLRSDSDLDSAIRVVDELIDKDELSPPEQDYLDVLSDLVEAYEDKTIVIEPVDDARLLRILIEGKGVAQVHVVKAVGIAESTISAVLLGKRKLNRDQIGSNG